MGEGSTRWSGLGALGGLGAAAVGATAALSAKRASNALRRYPPIGAIERVAGLAIHVLDRPGPTPDAPAIVLIHGASGNVRDFDFGFIERLCERFRVLALDRPGQGHSDRGPARRDAAAGLDPRVLGAPWDPSTQAALLREAVRARGVERPIVLGQSLGAASALAWAVDAPERCAGVLALAGVSQAWPGTAGRLYEIASTPVMNVVASNLIAAGARERWIIRQIDRIFRPQTAPDGYGEAIGVDLGLRASAIRANAEDVARLKPLLRIQASKYPFLAVPAAAVHGTQDTIVPASIHAQPFAASSAQVELTLLDGIGHMPHHSAREDVLAAIHRLADRAAAPSPSPSPSQV